MILNDVGGECAQAAKTLEKEALETAMQEMNDVASERESIVNELQAAIKEMEDLSAVKDLNLEELRAEKEEAASMFYQQVNGYQEKIESLETTLETIQTYIILWLGLMPVFFTTVSMKISDLLVEKIKC